MRILLLGAGTEPSFRTWQRALETAGVPHEAIILGVRRTHLSLRRDDGTPRSATSTSTRLVVAGDGSALVGIHRGRDGREEMVQTFDANAGQIQAHL